MAEPKGVTRTNISIPQELKEQMDAVGERVNWSAVAADAFRAKLLEIASHQTGAKMKKDIVARMRLADEADSNNTAREGREAGGTWAREEARPRQLRLLESFKKGAERYRSLSEMLAIHGNGTNEGIAATLFSAVNPLVQYDRAEVESFWEMILGDSGAALIDDHAYALGFVEGALEVWEKVKDEL